MITYFRGTNDNFFKKKQKYKTLTAVLESLDTVTINGATTTSVSLSVTGVGLIVLPISAGIVCAQPVGNKVLHKIILTIYDKYTKQHQKNPQTTKSLDNLFRKSLQDNLINKKEFEPLYYNFINYIDGRENESFLKNVNMDIKLKPLSQKKFNLEPRTQNCCVLF